jgi:hypothetical protein
MIEMAERKFLHATPYYPFFWASFSFCELEYGQHIASAATLGEKSGKLVILTPQFVAEAVSFHAIDESGYDWAASDEIYAVFADYSQPNSRVSETFKNVDTGDTRNFAQHDRCMTPQGACALTNK